MSKYLFTCCNFYCVFSLQFRPPKGHLQCDPAQALDRELARIFSGNHGDLPMTAGEFPLTYDRDPIMESMRRKNAKAQSRMEHKGKYVH